MKRSLELRWRWGERTIHLHGSLPLAVLLACILFQPTTDTLLACGLIGAAHLGGHAFLAWRSRATVTGIRLHALGGSLTLQGVAPVTRSLVGVGGVGGQLLLGMAVTVLLMLSAFDADSALLTRLTRLNLLVGLANLFPLPGSDGADLWALPARAQAQILDQQRQSWQGLIERDRQHTSLPLPLPAPRLPDPGLHARLQDELRARDALADAGIPEAVAQQADALLADVWPKTPHEG